jgi:hypothetical protein
MERLEFQNGFERRWLFMPASVAGGVLSARIHAANTPEDRLWNCRQKCLDNYQNGGAHRIASVRSGRSIVCTNLAAATKGPLRRVFAEKIL